METAAGEIVYRRGYERERQRERDREREGERKKKRKIELLRGAMSSQSPPQS